MINTTTSLIEGQRYWYYQIINGVKWNIMGITNNGFLYPIWLRK